MEMFHVKHFTHLSKPIYNHILKNKPYGKSYLNFTAQKNTLPLLLAKPTITTHLHKSQNYFT